MKFSYHGQLVLYFLILSSCGAVLLRKQNGSLVDKSKQITTPNRNNGNAIIVQIDPGQGAGSFKVSEDDINDATVAMISNDEDIEYCVIHPNQGTCKSIKEIKEEGNQAVENKKEDINGHPVHSNVIKFTNQGNNNPKKGGVLQIKAEKSKNKKSVSNNDNRKKKKKDKRSLGESSTVVILNPNSPLNVCYETESLINYVNEPLDMKISLCNITSSGEIIQSDDGGVISGSLIVNGDTTTTIPVPSRGVDGFSVVTFTPDSPGLYSVDIDIEAFYGKEVFDRQARGWLIQVPEKQLESVESASLHIPEEGESSAVLAVKFVLAAGYSPNEEETDSFIIHADIVDGNGEGIVTASTIANLDEDNSLQVTIQRDWFVGFTPPYSIEYLRISNLDGVALMIDKDISIEVDAKTFEVPWNRRLSESLEERELRMTHGIPPPQHQEGRGNMRRQLQGVKIIASHGYCSSDAWKNYLPNADKFEDYEKNRSHREFAELLGAFGDSYDSGNSCSVIAHSQGGAASLYLYTYYWSCLDNGPPRRLIQSVGTPYQGTGIAGNLAALGEVFGVGCGRNSDLTEDGSRNFLAGVPFDRRSKVYYYSTSFERKTFRYDYCSAATDLFLSDPEDGVVRKERAQLPGGNNMGHIEGQCHSSNMRDPPQTSDRIRDGDGERKSIRNEVMLQYAQSV